MSCDIDALLSAGNCFQCLSERGQLMVIAQLLCDISSGTSGGGLPAPGFVATGLSIDAAHTVAHGLGSVPTLVTLTVVAVNAVSGYSVGDQLEEDSFWQQAAGNGELSWGVSEDATNLVVTPGFLASDAISVARKGSPATFDIVNPNDFKITLRAWK